MEKAIEYLREALNALSSSESEEIEAVKFFIEIAERRLTEVKTTD